MTQTARRRWSRELTSEVDGIALGPDGPMIVHTYDAPAGGRWVEEAIPGKLGALDRSSGEIHWSCPCEVGYGRGFGAGLGSADDILVLGPGSTGHRIARMRLASGELIDTADIEAFDEADVRPDVSICVTPRHVVAIGSDDLCQRWSYAREGERYRQVARAQDRVFVAYTADATRKQGVLCLDAQTGEFQGIVIAPNQPVIHSLTADERGVTVLASDLSSALPRELLVEYLSSLPEDRDIGSSELALLALEPTALEGDAPLWYEHLGAGEDLPDVTITTDSDKLYIVRGALIEVRDLLTGRPLGDWAVPGLDQRVAFAVCQGACLLAEETRVSVFELPA